MFSRTLKNLAATNPTLTLIIEHGEKGWGFQKNGVLMKLETSVQDILTAESSGKPLLLKNSTGPSSSAQNPPTISPQSSPSITSSTTKAQVTQSKKPTRQTNKKFSSKNLNQLVDMGVDEDRALAALLENDDNLDKAINALFK